MYNTGPKMYIHDPQNAHTKSQEALSQHTNLFISLKQGPSSRSTSVNTYTKRGENKKISKNVATFSKKNFEGQCQSDN